MKMCDVGLAIGYDARNATLRQLRTYFFVDETFSQILPLTILF